MIRAAIELGGTVLIIAAVGVGVWWGLYQLRHQKRVLDRQEARDEAAFKADTNNS